MLKAPTDADLVRLRQFLNRLESDAKDAVEDAEIFRREIDRLKSEIAYLEAWRRLVLTSVLPDQGDGIIPLSAADRVDQILGAEGPPCRASSIQKTPRTSPNSEA